MNASAKCEGEQNVANRLTQISDKNFACKCVVNMMIEVPGYF